MVLDKLIATVWFLQKCPTSLTFQKFEDHLYAPAAAIMFTYTAVSCFLSVSFMSPPTDRARLSVFGISWRGRKQVQEGVVNIFYNITFHILGVHLNSHSRSTNVHASCERAAMMVSLSSVFYVYLHSAGDHTHYTIYFVVFCPLTLFSCCCHRLFFTHFRFLGMWMCSFLLL